MDLRLIFIKMKITSLIEESQDNELLLIILGLLEE